MYSEFTETRLEQGDKVRFRIETIRLLQDMKNYRT